MAAKKPIGIFDSGVGGLTVYKEIRRIYPCEDLVYFGDTARVPYGPKSPQTIIEYSRQNVRFLLQHQVKLIIVACNTASSFALESLRKEFPVPVTGVIEPGAKAAAAVSRNKRIGIIGTYGTVNSGAYQRELKSLDSSLKVFSKACPLFVPLVEEGLESHRITREIAAEYLAELIEQDIDALILGCTHYPILKDTLLQITQNKIKLIDSAEVIANTLHELLPQAEKSGKGKDLFFVSDNEKNFKKIAERILGFDINNLQLVESGESWFVNADNLIK